MLFEQEIQKIARLGFEEDRVESDITTMACLSSEEISADVLLKQKSIIAGLSFLPLIFKTLNPAIDVKLFAKDGEMHEPKTVLASIRGPSSSILSAERVALNILQHLCGIATKTASFVEAVKGYPCDILDTRKTLPGFRILQKYAVLIGGGKNHRFHLADCFLIKNNHLALLKKTSKHPVKNAIEKARAVNKNSKIEVEVEDLASLQEALSCGIDFIMLDNMTPALVKEAVKLNAGRAYLEASGGITLDNVKDYAKAGVNGISIGALTHSVSAIDLSLRVKT